MVHQYILIFWVCHRRILHFHLHIQRQHRCPFVKKRVNLNFLPTIMDMGFKPNIKQTYNQEYNSHTQPQPAPASYLRFLLVLLIILLLRRMVHGITNMMKRKKRAEFDTQKQKQKEEKGINIKMVGQSSKCFCGICLDFKAESDMFRGGKCNHPFCIDCIPKHVVAQIQQNVLKVNCPNPNCHVELKPEYLQPILPKEVIDRWEFAKYESSLPLSQKFYCPFKNCSALLVNDGYGGNVVTSSECPYCHRLFCAQCKVQWHAGMNCKEFQNLKRNKGEKDLDRKFMELAKSNMWQRCPKCSIYVQRRSGCEHMICSCGCHFCYNCGKNWKFGHLCNSRRST